MDDLAKKKKNDQQKVLIDFLKAFFFHLYMIWKLRFKNSKES